MHNKDPYGFGDTVSLEAFDMAGTDLARAEDGHALSELMSAVNSMEEISSTITANRGISRGDAVALESLAPGILPSVTPVNSYTLHPTPTNLKLALEAIEGWRNSSFMNILKAVWKFVMGIVNWVTSKIKGLFGKSSSPKDGKRVVANTQATVNAADDIITQTSPNVDAKTVERYNEALEKAKLKVSDHFNHLLRDLINTPGTVSAINQLRSNIHEAFGKLDTISGKYASAIDLSRVEASQQDAINTLVDIAGFKPATLVNLSDIACIIDITKKSSKLPGDEQAKTLKELAQRQRKKQSSWDVKTVDVVQSFSILTDRVIELCDAIDDEQIGQDIPEVKDFSDKAKAAPEPLRQPLLDASSVLTQGFEVLQDTIALFVQIYEELMSLTQAMWDAAKTLMGTVANAAKQNSEVKAVVAGIEDRLKQTLKKA